MNQQEANKNLLRRWYDDMWNAKAPHLIHEIVGEVYVRHESDGTYQVTPAEYEKIVSSVMGESEISEFKYRLVSEGDLVCAIGTWLLDGTPWNWTQAFRIENNRLVETWLSGLTIGKSWDRLPL